jgi:hypothetical protein
MHNYFFITYKQQQRYITLYKVVLILQLLITTIKSVKVYMLTLYTNFLLLN